MTDYEMMCISAVRYALGRRTYIVGITCRYMSDIAEELSRKCRDIMMDDIIQQQRFGYGDDCDAQDWMQLLTRLEQIRRKEDGSTKGKEED